MIAALPRMFTGLAQKYLPDAYLFALILTFIVFACGIAFQGATPMEMVGHWGDGFWTLTEFSMQMAMILIAGFTLAKTSAVQKILKALASLAKTNTQAVAIVTVVSCLACYINWGFGLVCSALLALELAKTVRKVNYGLLISSAYSGFLVWHGGISGSIPLKLTDPQDSIKAIIGVDSIPLGDTLYSGLNLTLLISTVVVLLALNLLLSRDQDQVAEVFLSSSEKSEEEGAKMVPQTFSEKLENSRLVNIAIGAFFLLYALRFFFKGGSLGLNMVIFLFLGLGVILHFRPIRFLKAFNGSVSGASGILLQFPFYAGIMGMMSSSGLAQSLSEFFISIADQDTFLFFSYLSAGIVNFFVPSGGGQWAIQGPILLPAAKGLGVDFAQASMAIAWGDAWTNMVQPFWALPLLAAGRCKLRTMMGYSAMVFLVIGALHSAIFLLM